MIYFKIKALIHNLNVIKLIVNNLGSINYKIKKIFAIFVNKGVKTVQEKMIVINVWTISKKLSMVGTNKPIHIYLNVHKIVL